MRTMGGTAHHDAGFAIFYVGQAVQNSLNGCLARYRDRVCRSIP
eukprot:COSAG05_NODE_538_length_8854_cov_306.308738_2_plen_44_part_00